MPSKLTVDNIDIYDPKLISEKFNEFFVNIGNNVEAKIPQSKINQNHMDQIAYQLTY